MACAILERTSGLEPSSETTAQRYLKPVIVPNFCSFTFISIWVSLALFVISLVFSALISILYLVQASDRASMSSANRRLVIFLPPMQTFPSCSSRASDMIPSSKMLKRVGDKRHSLPYSDCCSEPFSYAAIHLDCTCSLVIELLNNAN